MATYDRFAGIDDNYLFPPEVMTAIAGGSSFSNRFYTKTVTDTILDGKSDVDHIHDTRYYTRAQADNKVDLKVAGIFSAVVLEPTTNLNDATEVGKEYVQPSNADATTAMNYPIQEAGSLRVLPYSTHPDRRIQRYTSYQSLRIFQRSRYSGAWSSWKEHGAAPKDTGWRDISSLMPDGTVEGNVFIRRIGDAVHWQLRLSKIITTGSRSTAIPSGFRPGLGIYDGFVMRLERYASGDVHGQISLNGSGTLSLYRAVPVTGQFLLTGSYVSYDPFPSTLPGTPA